MSVRLVNQIVVEWAWGTVGLRKVVLAIDELGPVLLTALLVLGIEKVVLAVAENALSVVIGVTAPWVTNWAALLGLIRPASTSSAAVVDWVVFLLA